MHEYHCVATAPAGSIIVTVDVLLTLGIVKTAEYAYDPQAFEIAVDVPAS